MRAPALLAATALLVAPPTGDAGPLLMPRAPAADTTVIVLLGTGMPRPDPDASGPATAIVVGSRVFLFDAGPGVERRLSAAKLPINGVTALFLTHLHSDHTLGLPDLIFTSWVMGRRTPMAIFGPHATRAMTDHILAAWQEDIAIRTEGLEHGIRDGWRRPDHPVQPGNGRAARGRLG